MDETPAPVPADFPRRFSGAIAGAQPKVLLQLTEGEGLCSELSERAVATRAAFCLDLCAQLVAYCERKAFEDPSREQGDIVTRVTRSKQLNDYCSQAEAKWVLERMVARLGWLLPPNVLR
jgi:hypothetical protein